MDLVTSTGLTGINVFKFEISVMFITVSVIGGCLQGSAPLRDLPAIIWRSLVSGWAQNDILKTRCPMSVNLCLHFYIKYRNGLSM